MHSKVYQALRALRVSSVVIAGFTAVSNAQVITESSVITGFNLNSFFGDSVAIDGNRILIGSPGDGQLGPDAGAAFLYDATTNLLIQKLLPTDPVSFGQFGESVAIEDGYAVVGASRDEDNGNAAGAVYVFDASTGVFLRKLTATDGAPGQMLGRSVDIDSGVVAAGAGFGEFESAYLFDAGTGAELQKLEPVGSFGFEEFGFSVAIGDGVVAVGAVNDSTADGAAGAVYLFDADTGVQSDKLFASDASFFGSFGQSVSLDAGTLAVGSSSGSAYAFDVATGNELVAFPGGQSVSISNGRIATGSIFPRFVHIVDAATGVLEYELEASDASAGSEFGGAVALDGERALVGAVLRFNIEGVGVGGVYRYDAPASVCLPDLAPPEGVLNFFDLGEFLTRFNAQDPSVDFAAPFGVWNFFDLGEFLSLFNQGCP